jgi:putative NADPH-quinone reductase
VAFEKLKLTFYWFLLVISIFSLSRTEEPCSWKKKSGKSEILNLESTFMKASVILAHPYSKSFNHAIFHTVCSKLEAFDISLFKHDLYEEKFDPVLTAMELGFNTSTDPLVNKYTQELIESDLLFFIHPNWWGQPPAMLKGYVDRVIRPPYAYDFPPGDTGGGLPIRKLKARYGIVFNTSNTEKEREENYFSDPLEKIWKQCIFGFCGIEKYYRKMFRIIADSTMDIRKMWLQDVERIVENVVRDIL